MIKSEQYKRLGWLVMSIVAGALMGGAVEKYAGGEWIGLLIAILMIIWGYCVMREANEKSKEIWRAVKEEWDL